jgi:perosamine synthetase
VDRFEEAFAATVTADHAVAVSNGTAALHAAVFSAGIGPGDEVVVPALTFVATANSVLYMGGKPVFADVDPGTLLIEPDRVAEVVSPRTKAVIAVDYTGQPCDYDRLRGVTDEHGLTLIADACHALGGSFKGRAVGSLADLSTFSFHPVKHIATGEGGMITTDDSSLARRLKVFRNHGITSDHRQRAERGSWAYEMVDLGFNYRLTDLQCALGLSQLERLTGWVERRRAIAAAYREGLANVPGVAPLTTRPEIDHAYHLFVVFLTDQRLARQRELVFRALRAEGVGVNVHYLPVHLHPYYRRTLGTGPGLCPVAEAASQAILSLPMFPAMTDDDLADVVRAVDKVARSVLAR